MKNLIIVIVASALFLGVGAGVSYAYLSAQEYAGNEFGTADVAISVREDFEPPGTVTPGQTVKKAPRIESISGTDCYVRAAVRFSDSDMQEACEPLVIGSGWEAGTDGYYYWKQRLKPGEATGALFDGIKIRTDAAEPVPFDIYVYAEAVQCGELGEQEAWENMEESV